MPLLKSRTTVSRLLVVLLITYCFAVSLLGVKIIPLIFHEELRHVMAYDTSKFEFDVHPQCGNGRWQRDYSQLHQSILQRPLEDQRLAVFDGMSNGAGDRLTMAVTVFLYALISDRAFKIRWKGVPLEHALDYVGVNWTAVETDFDAQYGRVERRNYMSTRVGIVGRELDALFRDTDISLIGSSNETYSDYMSSEVHFNTSLEARTVVWQLNQGQMWTLFDNPHHKNKLYELGLTPETAFGCILNFLFRPQEDTIRLLEKEWAAALNEADPVAYVRSYKGLPLTRKKGSKDVLSGIQVRYGDTVLREQRCDPTDEWTQLFFKCDDSLHSHRMTESKILLLTDCLELRSWAKTHFRDRVITSTTPGDQAASRVEHIEGVKKDNPQTLQWIISEIWLLSVADVHIISSQSNVGRVAALLSLKWHSTFTFSNVFKDLEVQESRKGRYNCSRTAYSTWKDLSLDWVRL